MKGRPVSDKSTQRQAFTASLKIIIPLYATYILFVVSIFAVFLPLLKNHMMGQKKEMIHSLTESTWSLLSEYDQRVKQGELSLEDAQQRAVRRIRNLRYGMEGKDQTDFVDSRGKHVFSEFVKTVEKDGSGCVEYLWHWKDDQSRIVAKISYVKGFSPWGWVIGTGLYLEDVDQEEALNLTESDIGYIVFLNEDETLLNAEKRYRSLFMMAPLPLMEISREGSIIQLNQEVMEVLGYKNHEIQTVSDLWNLAVPDDEDRKNMSLFWSSAIQKGGNEGKGIWSGIY
jgi:PAS domain-containing protein